MNQINENNKKSSDKDVSFESGHRACAGCPISIIFNGVLSSTDYELVVSNATGCAEVVSTIYPFSSWNVPWIHNTFENAAATISGVEAAYKSFKNQNKMDKDFKFVAFGGDGGTYDIGLQSLSGALERGHDFAYICYDNGAYMNTGNQRSSATPLGSETTTSPFGEKHPAKEQRRKDLAKIAEAHDIDYVAQASVSHIDDLKRKAKKAIETDGPAVLVVLSPCPTMWKFPSEKTLDVAKVAVETNFWPIFEIEKGVMKLNFKPKDKKPVTEFMKMQGRFRHSIKNDSVIKKIQDDVDDTWDKLLRREKIDNQNE
ncbi:MAG: thiamine pyrophosphate-dependent enzyme [Candidatus Woesearchaeota archaeon]